MTGTGGMLWKSKDLRQWTGPYSVKQTDPNSWMGPRPMIWAAELHAYQGNYYYFASDSPWSKERNGNGDIVPNKVTDGPYVFRTATGKLGIIWTSWMFGDYTQGAAYSQSGTLDGPWLQEKDPITPPNCGHGMLFRTFEGKLLMSVHSHAKVNGRTVRIPHLFKVDDTGDKIIVGKPY